MRTSSKLAVLLIDNDRVLSETLHSSISAQDVQTFLHAGTIQEGLKKNRENNCDIILLRDILPDGTATQAVQNLKSNDLHPEIIIFTTQGDPDQAEFALKNGVWDYVIDPLPENVLPGLLKRVVRFLKSKINVEQSRQELEDDFSSHGIIGSSPLIKNCLYQATKISQSDSNVLITGESGTGKELFARAIHNFSDRSKKRLIVVDCAALPSTLVESILFGHSKGSFTGADNTRQGLIKQADGGTLFLDEIGEMPLAIQKKLLRVIQERIYRPVGSTIEIQSDFRLVAATNKVIPAMVEEGSFREDLYFRLKTFQIELPPLRDRNTDIAELTYHFRDVYCRKNKLKKKKFSSDYLSILGQYGWPGNVRELFHAVERSITAAHDSAVLYANHLPTSIRIAVTKKKLQKGHDPEAVPVTIQTDSENNMPTIQEIRNSVVEAAERQYLARLAVLAGDDVKKCCAISGLSRSRFYELLKKYNISR